jgi:uncharacterized Fe-S cluster-containing radical SAM superfamily protein
MTDNYCPLPFHGLYVERLPNGKNLLSPCCLAKTSKPVDQIDFNNNTHLTKIRNGFLLNKKPTECEQCWKLEELGGESRRLVYRDIYQNIINPNGLITLDYNTLPICNAKCVICGPKYSSTWATASGSIEVKDVKDVVKNSKKSLNNLDLNNITHLYFNGGEPLLTEEHVEVLKQVKNADISYNTNGSCFPKKHVIDLWKQQKSVTIFFSIDAIGKNFNIIREKLDWNQVSENILKFNELGFVKIGCSYTIGGHNVYDLEPTINWFSKIINVKENFHVHYVNPGHKLYFNNFKDQRELFLNEIKKFKDFYWFESISNAIRGL